MIVCDLCGKELEEQDIADSSPSGEAHVCKKCKDEVQENGTMKMFATPLEIWREQRLMMEEVRVKFVFVRKNVGGKNVIRKRNVNL